MRRPSSPEAPATEHAARRDACIGESWRHGLPARRSRRGFTILELVIVFVVVAVVASLAVPAFFERSEVTLSNACDLLAKDLRHAQSRAAFHRMPVRVRFRTDGDGYEVLDRHDLPLKHPLDDGEFVRRYSVDAVFEGVRVTHVECGPGGALEYGPNGFPLAGGYVILGFRDDARIVHVEPQRGEVRILGEPPP